MNSLGLVYADEGDYKNARRTFLEAIKLGEEEEMLVSVANAKSNLGQLYFDHDRIDTALALFQTCLQIDRDLELEWGIGYQLSNIGGRLRVVGEETFFQHPVENLVVSRL